MISVFAHAAVTNRTYCHTPWTYMDHSEGLGLTGHQLAKAMWKFVGGAALGPRAAPATPPQLHAHTEMDADAGERWLRSTARTAASRVRQAYFGAAPSKPRLRLFNRTAHCGRHVALHVRAGDVSGDPNSSNVVRWTTPEAINDCVRVVLARVRTQLPRGCGTPQLHVFSEARRAAAPGASSGAGEEGGTHNAHASTSSGAGHHHHHKAKAARPPELSYLSKYAPVAFHTAGSGVGDLQSTFHHMVEADALIIAKSAFSAAAAYLSSGPVFAPFRPHAPYGYGFTDDGSPPANGLATFALGSRVQQCALA